MVNVKQQVMDNLKGKFQVSSIRKRVDDEVTIICKFSFNGKNGEFEYTIYGRGRGIYFSQEMIFKVFKLTKLFEIVKVKTGNDYPIYVETEEFIIILAPKVYGGDYPLPEGFEE